MKIAKFLPHALIIAVLAAGLQYIDFETKNMVCAWIAFQAWALYFMAGCTIQGGAKSLVGWLCGIAASIAIVEAGTAFSSGMVPKFAFPIAVFIIAFVVILFEKAPDIFTFIPSWFVAAGAFFAVHADGSKYSQMTLTKIVLSGVVGLLFGVMTVFLRGKYSEMIGENADEAAEEAAEAA